MVRKSPNQSINKSTVQDEPPSQLSSRRSVMRTANGEPTRRSNRMSMRSISRSKYFSKTAVNLVETDTALHQMRQDLINNMNPKGNANETVRQSFVLIDQSSKSMENTYQKMVALRDQKPRNRFLVYQSPQ